MNTEQINLLKYLAEIKWIKLVEPGDFLLIRQRSRQDEELVVWNYKTDSVQRFRLRERVREVYFLGDPELALLLQTAHNELEVNVVQKNRHWRNESGLIENVIFTPDGKEALVLQEDPGGRLVSRFGFTKKPSRSNFSTHPACARRPFRPMAACCSPPPPTASPACGCRMGH